MTLKKLTDAEYAEFDEKLRPKLTPGFLETLVDAAQTFGNSGDWPAVQEFVEWAFDIAGRERPALKPHDTE